MVEGIPGDTTPPHKGSDYEEKEPTTSDDTNDNNAVKYVSVSSSPTRGRNVIIAISATGLALAAIIGGRSLYTSDVATTADNSSAINSSDSHQNTGSPAHSSTTTTVPSSQNTTTSTGSVSSTTRAAAPTSKRSSSTSSEVRTSSSRSRSYSENLAQSRSATSRPNTRTTGIAPATTQTNTSPRVSSAESSANSHRSLTQDNSVEKKQNTPAPLAGPSRDTASQQNSTTENSPRSTARTRTSDAPLPLKLPQTAPTATTKSELTEESSRNNVPQILPNKDSAPTTSTSHAPAIPAPLQSPRLLTRDSATDDNPLLLSENQATPTSTLKLEPLDPSKLRGKNQKTTSKPEPREEPTPEAQAPDNTPSEDAITVDESGTLTSDTPSTDTTNTEPTDTTAPELNDHFTTLNEPLLSSPEQVRLLSCKVEDPDCSSNGVGYDNASNTTSTHDEDASPMTQRLSSLQSPQERHPERMDPTACYEDDKNPGECDENKSTQSVDSSTEEALPDLPATDADIFDSEWDSMPSSEDHSDMTPEGKQELDREWTGVKISPQENDVDRPDDYLPDGTPNPNAVE